MIEERPAKRPRGRPEVSDDERLVQRSLRMTAEQWRIFDAHGGVTWLRVEMDASAGIFTPATSARAGCRA